MAAIPPWSPYSDRQGVASAGRTSLVAAFADFVKVRRSFESFEVTEIWSAPDDCGENEACRDLIRFDAEFMGLQFLTAKLDSYARPIHGGDVTKLDASRWEIDDPLQRFATGVFSMRDWADPAAAPTHRLFVSTSQFNLWLAGQRPLGPLTAQEFEVVVDPRRKAQGLSMSNGGVATSAASVEPCPKPIDCATELPELLDIAAVMKLTTLGKSTIHARKKIGSFPQSFDLGGNTKRWFKAEVLEWIAERAALRGT